MRQEFIRAEENASETSLGQRLEKVFTKRCCQSDHYYNILGLRKLREDRAVSYVASHNQRYNKHEDECRRLPKRSHKRVEEALAKYKTVDDALEEIRKLNLETYKHKANNPKKIVSEEQLEHYLNQGWDVQTVLPSGKTRFIYMVWNFKVGLCLNGEDDPLSSSFVHARKHTRGRVQ